MWFLSYAYRDPFPPFESKSIAADLLTLTRAGLIKLTPWQFAFLHRVRLPGVAMSERERLLIRRMWEDTDGDWMFPAPDESPDVVAERAVKRALGLDGVKRKRRTSKDEPKAPKLTRQEAEIDCPVCRTGAQIHGWNNGAGTVVFFCQNRRCVSKMPHVQGWHPERAEKIL